MISDVQEMNNWVKEMQNWLNVSRYIEVAMIIMLLIIIGCIVAIEIKKKKDKDKKVISIAAEPAADVNDEEE